MSEIPEKNENPYLKTNRERYFRTGRKSLTEGEVNKLLSVITDLEHSALIMLAVSAGIRRGDIVKIKQKDFDYEKRKIIFFESKKNRTHTVYVPNNTAKVIQMLINSNKNEVYLFPGGTDRKHGKGHISDKSAYNILNRYLEKAGLDKRPFHALRATCIKMCQKKGWKPEETAELVGDSLRVIQEHYSVPSEQEMKEVSEEKAIL